MALTNETKSEAVKKTATKHKAAPTKDAKGEKREKKGKKAPAEKQHPAIVPTHLRGVIKGNLPKRAKRLGGDVTNAEFAKENGITTRMASKVRDGRRKLAA